ncbi:Eco57I restriction-modification methylase domain-containing protein, partial [Bacteroides heparinolyticus]|uniref:Eco57I restriction-modification methylase domain-containing protein n=3 Tax=Bacteroidales TaxID=171549 RepID=UPI0035A1AE37
MATAYTPDRLRNLFQSSFDMVQWYDFLQHLFKASELKEKPERIIQNTSDEGYYLGTIDTADSFRIGLFHYYILQGSVANKRVGLRNLVKSFINPNWGEFDAALVVFDSDDHWRLSFICDIKGEATSPKRYTYVFGDNDSLYKTPVERFDFLQKKGISFENLKEAFSVEALSKEFFDKYRKHYADFVEYITGKQYVKSTKGWIEKQTHEPHPQLQEQFFGDEKRVRDYIKKLLGRIVFLHYLQRKGWLGVPQNKSWGEGDTDFMRHLFEYATEEQRADFIEEILEPLFYDALNTNRGSDGDLFDTQVEFPKVGTSLRIPYLNGGLFEADENDKLTVQFPSVYFKNLLDFFSQYNFTIDENDPSDAQVGVDPEMLGRIFESLLEDNKDKGAFYTPKEIVQYMCRESLIAYLQTDQREEDKDCIRQFVLTHDAVLLGDLKGDINQRLCDVKICDPAIGSGAFPMGLLRELFFCRSAINPNIVGNATNIKRHIIQNNIYGVDIERGAVDIARLRFWLSLIVDEASPETLPNLDFKIMQGNSLLEQHKGVDLSTMTEKKVGTGQGMTIFDSMLDVYRKELRDKLAEYYACPEHDKKIQLRKDIADIVKQELIEQGIQIDFEDLDLSANGEFFLWHTWFHDVFSRPSKEGFDIVIGNPPYGAKYDNQTKRYYKNTYVTANSICGLQKGSL